MLGSDPQCSVLPQRRLHLQRDATGGSLSLDELTLREVRSLVIKPIHTPKTAVIYLIQLYLSIPRYMEYVTNSTLPNETSRGSLLPGNKTLVMGVDNLSIRLYKRGTTVLVFSTTSTGFEPGTTRCADFGSTTCAKCLKLQTKLVVYRPKMWQKRSI